MNTWYRSSIWVLCWCVLSIHSHPTDTTRRPAYVECVSSSECGFDSCCVLGMGRYSVPQCQKKLLLYESCRPNSDHPVNSTVAYLDGTMVSLNNVHLLMCPCANGLTCDHKTGRCEDFDTNSSFNEIDYGKFNED